MPLNAISSDKPIRVAVYTRKSTVKGLEREDNSLAFQREACLDFIKAKKAQGWRANPKKYDDGGFTGANTDRPALQALIQDAKAGKFDVVTVYKVDRISRSLGDLVSLVEGFLEQGINFVSVSESFDTNQPIGRFSLNILGCFGQLERETISERIRDKMGSARRKGKYIGGKPVLGFDVDKEHRRLVINEQEAETVRGIFESYLHFGCAQPVLVDLNARDIRTKRWVTQTGKVLGGKAINRQYLMSLLQNRHYVGQVVYQGEIYDGEHEALLDQALFDEVQSLLEKNKYRDRVRSLRGGLKHASYDVLLRGLIYCEHSGALMKPTYTMKSGKKYFYYVCTEQLRVGFCGCRRKRIAANRIEADVLGEIRLIGKDARLIDSMVEQASASFSTIQSEFRQRLAEQKQQRKRLLGKIGYLKAKSDRPAGVEALRAEVVALESAMTKIKNELAALGSGFSTADFRQALQLFDPIWDALPFEERYRLLGLLVDRVVYNGNEGKFGTFQIFFRRTGIQALGSIDLGATHAS